MLETQPKAEVHAAIRCVGVRPARGGARGAEPPAIRRVIVEHRGVEYEFTAHRRHPFEPRHTVRTADAEARAGGTPRRPRGPEQPGAPAWRGERDKNPPPPP